MTFCNSLVRVCTISDSECTKNCRDGKCRSTNLNAGSIWAGKPIQPIPNIYSLEKVVKTPPADISITGLDSKATRTPSPTFQFTSDQFKKLLEESASLRNQFQSQIEKDLCTNGLLSIKEQEAVLADLTGLECLINHHELSALRADASGLHEHYIAHQERIAEIQVLILQIIKKDPTLWASAQILAHREAYSGI